MRAVLDTVVVVRAAISPAGPAARLTERAGEFDLVTSQELIDEALDVLLRPSLAGKLRGRRIDVVERITERLNEAELVAPSTIERVCRDPNDDKLFACAKAASVDYIVSDDNDVLAVGEYGGARTITTLAFLQVLDELARS